MKDFGEDYEETKNLHFYYAFADRNEFSHKSTKISHFPSLKFYPRAKPGETKKKWINYKESLDYKGLERVIRNYLDGITLQDLLEQQTARAANDYVI
mgnify:CR=1 FL=1